MGLFTHCFRTSSPQLGCRSERVLDLGRAPNAGHAFNMTHLALNGARRINGVSRIHGAVSSRAVRRSLAGSAAGGEPGRLRDQRRARADLPGADLEPLLRRQRSGPSWRERLSDRDFWHALTEVPGLRVLGDGAAGQGAHARRRARAAAARISRQGPESGAAAPHHAAARSGAAQRADARALRAALRPTSAPRCCCAIARACCG